MEFSVKILIHPCICKQITGASPNLCRC